MAKRLEKLKGKNMRISRFPTTSEDDLGILWQKHTHMVKWREKLKATLSTYNVEYSPPKIERQKERQEYEESITRSSCNNFAPTDDLWSTGKQQRMRQNGGKS